MAHFAQIDENNIVLQVIAVNNDDILVDGVESEAKGIEFCKTLLGQDTNWLQTSYNSNFRKHYAIRGGDYRPDIDAFIYPQPYPSWTLNTTTANWEPPVPDPSSEENGTFDWNEELQQWVPIKI
jgi:hypothetical protein